MLEALGQQLAQAQERGDGAELDAPLTDDVRLVGPFGSVLDTQTWLGQHQSGATPTVISAWRSSTDGN